MDNWKTSAKSLLLSNTNDVLHGNAIIAGFMGYNVINNTVQVETQSLHISEFQYNTNWNWIMPVVNKIENLNYEVAIYGKGTSIYKGIFEESITGGFIIGDTKLESVWKACVCFSLFHENKKNI